ncbi:hypothetical protein BJI67_01445 [Acidihalobacter aeolianus]|uniref:KfrA N-terminal DNA-binding domain-containing protein n=1 Tax=Acidihalobacter aeolianus TaxID=2792603 RepID=A0A1D8K4N5_9GAMM|nr:DNA-binding protein [Acidihalobacter aeolianus]AOV15913.1 hypothetical protein BJI67_01445 [Acidihalobacter aeolianus]
MGNKGITFEDVERAAAALKAQGQRATNMAVRYYLGTGSMKTINNHMKVINARAFERSAQQKDIPAEVEAVLHQTIASVWTQAQSLATQDIEAIRSLARERIERSEAELEELNEAFDAKVEELAALQVKYGQLEAKVETLRTEAAVSLGQRQALEQQIKDLIVEFRPKRKPSETRGKRKADESALHASGVETPSDVENG